MDAALFLTVMKACLRKTFSPSSRFNELDSAEAGLRLIKPPIIPCFASRSFSEDWRSVSSEEETSINKVCFGNDLRFFVEKTDVPANRRTAVFQPCFINVAARVGARAEQSSVIMQRGFSGSKL